MNGLLFFFKGFARPLGVVIAGVAGVAGGVAADGLGGVRVGVCVGVVVAGGCADPDPLLAAAVGAGLARASR